MYINERMVSGMELCELKDCVGCFSCMNVCPKHAITVEHDKLKKTVPKINAQLCVECGLCRKSCPVLNESEFNEPDKCYAAWTLDKDDQINCASGGIATALSRVFMKKGGKVFGTDWDDELNLNIRMANDESDLEKFKSSKYVQSFVGNSYTKAKEELIKGERVLYIGTPCQIDGLLHFLGKKYDNLYTVDIICHGAPPIEYLKEYVHSILPDKTVSEIKFRGENNYQLTIFDGTECLYNVRAYDDFYFETFLKGVTYRDNCYSCKYARRDRVSDLTIGDFWGLDKNTLKEQYDGRISTILANSDKGKKLLDECINAIHIEERLYEEALKYNEQLNHPSEMHFDREVFIKNYDGDFYKSVCKTSIGQRIKKDQKVNRIKSSGIYQTIKKVVKR